MTKYSLDIKCIGIIHALPCDIPRDVTYGPHEYLVKLNSALLHPQERQDNARTTRRTLQTHEQRT